MRLRLWVDDIRPAPPGWHHARTVTEAIRILDEQEVFEASIDHDISHSVQLNGIHRPYPCGETFEPVARFIRQLVLTQVIEDGEPKLKQVVIHTANSIGAEKMVAIFAPVSKILVVKVMPMHACNRLEADQ